MNLPRGTAVYFGPPAKPLPSEMQAKIAQAVSGIPGIVEAHLPQCYSKGFIDPSAQVLVLVLEPGVNAETVMPRVNENIKSAIPTGRYIDIFPLVPNHPFLPIVRQCDTKLLIE
jgi:hypothetical protein